MTFAAGLTDIEASRFCRKVEIHPDGCWRWTGALNSRGYGCVGIRRRRHLAHRVAYEAATGRTIPDGLTIDHLCFEKRCVNPAHMEVVTRSLNSQRGSLRHPRPRKPTVLVDLTGTPRRAA